MNRTYQLDELTKAPYRTMHLDDVNHHFSSACIKGDLELVRFLLTSNELKNNADIHYMSDISFYWACGHGHLAIVKYLLHSPELRENVDMNCDNNNPFKNACLSKENNIIDYFIFDLNITRTDDIDDYLKENNLYYIINMMDVRKLDLQLKNKDDTIFHKVKI